MCGTLVVVGELVVKFLCSGVLVSVVLIGDEVHNVAVVGVGNKPVAFREGLFVVVAENDVEFVFCEPKNSGKIILEYLRGENG